MVLSYLIREVSYKVNGNLVNSVVIVAVFREVTLNLLVNNDAVFISDTFYLGIFYS